MRKGTKTVHQGSSHTSLPPPTSLSSSLLAPGDLRQSLGRNSTVTAISEEGEGECDLSTQFIDWSARYEVLSPSRAIHGTKQY